MQTLCKVVETAIPVQAILDGLQRDSDGALATFTGVVRDHHRGRPVSHLEYHAYPEMAEEELQRIARELSERFAVGGVALVHRTGELAVGEASVLVAATAPHRKDALGCVAEGIEAVKRRVPVWKKEFFTDGGEPEWIYGPDEGCVTPAGPTGGE